MAENTKGKKVLTKEARIKKEYNALKRNYKTLPKDRLNVVEGLIQRAAFMKISLEDMEVDLDENGFVEEFQQSPNVEPYERLRPVASIYNSMNKNYQTIIKELSSQLVQVVNVKAADDENIEPANIIELFANSRK